MEEEEEEEEEQGKDSEREEEEIQAYRPSLKRALEYTGGIHEMVAELLVTTTATLPGASGGTGRDKHIHEEISIS